MRTKQVIQAEIEALQKELESAPVSFEQEPDGLYVCLKDGTTPRFIFKQNDCIWSINSAGTTVIQGSEEINRCISQGIYTQPKIRILLQKPAPVEKIDVDWKLIDGPIYNVEHFAEMKKLAAWARPLLEGK